MAIVSAIDTFGVLDDVGVRRVTGWFDVEFRESYTADGIGIDLSPYFRTIRAIMGQAVSGVYNYKPEGDPATFTTPVSARIKLNQTASGNISILSGMGYIGSGQSQALSGRSDTWQLWIASGTLAAAQFGEVPAIAISGTRVRLQVLGF